MAFNTGKPVEPNGSTDPRDLKDNAAIIDKLVNSSDLTWLGRLGKTLKTWAGMTADFVAAQLQRTNDFQAFLQNISFEVPVAYAPGISITRSTQTVLYNGQAYRPKAEALPFVTTTFPADESKWLLAGDSSLRQDLAAAPGSGKVGFDEAQAYPAGTVGNRLKELNAPGIDKEQRTFSDLDLLPNLGNTKTLDAAIRSGTVRVAFAGDSITQGDADSLYDNSSAAIIMRRLREENPRVTFVFSNFSIAGLGIPSFSNPNYKGMAPPADPFVGFYRPPGDALTGQWPGGSVAGKSWIDHLKDWAPDLVCNPFGANDVGWTSLELAAYSKQAIDYMESWAKPPSIAWGAAARPATVSIYGEAVQKAANVARSIARQRNLTLLDFNRLHNVRRFAVDVDNPFYVRDDAFAGFPTNWTLDPGTTLALSTVTPGALEGQGTATRNTLSQDCNLEAFFTATNWSATTVGLLYRDLGTNDGGGQNRYSAFASATAVSLYWAGTMIGSYSYAAIPNGTAIKLRVDVRGALHRVFVNGIERITVWNYGNVMQGKHAVTVVGGFGAVYGFSAHLGNNYVVGRQQLNDVDIYGVNDFATNQNSLGGNGNNHFTKLGNTVIMAAGYFPLTHHMKTVYPKLSSVIVPFTVTGTTQVFDAAGTTLRTQIEGTGVGAATYPLVTSSGATASKQDSAFVNVLTDRNVTCEILSSSGPTSFLQAVVPFTVGLWQVNVSAQFTKNSAGVYANTLTVTAIRIV
ncbi:hypothetical protein N4P55_06895 [Pseudomonas fluorescens]|uniref:hypothetical protein n=1 Tax=Pseudomonas fluorescens TaxID=294 RepID=UPI0021CEFAB4|nr:hypothetical protein [Pseudomonas fluorescens]UXV21078.1 hypothetical protein N4P55_06895 [Pseudomonas fluorescens]